MNDQDKLNNLIADIHLRALKSILSSPIEGYKTCGFPEPSEEVKEMWEKARKEVAKKAAER